MQHKRSTARQSHVAPLPSTRSLSDVADDDPGSRWRQLHDLDVAVPRPTPTAFREGGRVVNAVAPSATGRTGTVRCLACGWPPARPGRRTSEFFADLVAPGLAGVKLVTSDAHADLVEAITANLPGATWQRCRADYAANLMSICPKSM